MVDSRLKKISTAKGVIDVLGGPSAAARLADCTPANITNALARLGLPYPTFQIFSDELAARGFHASPELWGIKPARRRRA